ncbi:MAG: TonB family protein, partial [Lentimicrobium sp.]|nr:TonB family protein [Lentimicrobium sp.]
SDLPGVPYFEIPSSDAAESLPLKSTVAEVQIAGLIAHVTVRQVYQNRGKTAIEAIYIFPGSTRAAVHSMTMKIGERSINAKIEEREKARNDYTQAVNEGRSASLLEQQRPNVFQMSVGNILPGDLVEVELQYTENLVPADGIYEFVYPTVVGPRYTGAGDERIHQDAWNANPYLQEGELPTFTFALDCSISSGIPIREIKSTSHKINVEYSDKRTAAIHLDKTELQSSNRDFILQYRLGGNGIESGLWLYSDGKENFFMATIQPPDVVKPEMIPPREYIFIVDVSGSMHGFPLEVSKKLIADLLKGLRTSDKFNIMFFAGGNTLFAEKSVPVTEVNISKAMKLLDSQSGGGGTELLPALKRALAMNTNEGYSRTFIIATDGFVTIEQEAFGLVKSNLGKANFFAFGIGSSVNRYLIEGLAHAGSGEAFIITDEHEAKVTAGKFREYISSPVLTGVELTFSGFDAYDVQPATVPDVFMSRPVVVFGKYRGNAVGRITLTGSNGNGKISQVLQVSEYVESKENQALRYLWAREKIRLIDDYAGGYGGVPDDVKKQVLGLGLQYNLLTAYTSFVAIDSEIRNINGAAVTVRQPLPLPEGVSNYAIGGAQAPGMSFCKMSRAESLSGGVELTEDKDADPSEEEVFTIVESMPEFPGGEEALNKFLKSNLKMPEEAMKNNVSGIVIIRFVVNADGTISDIVVLQSLGFGCDAEAIRVIKAMPAWIPGKQRGKSVKTKVSLPVHF